jgi:hypothetical protein
LRQDKHALHCFSQVAELLMTRCYLITV